MLLSHGQCRVGGVHTELRAPSRGAAAHGRAAWLAKQELEMDGVNDHSTAIGLLEKLIG